MKFSCTAIVSLLRIGMGVCVLCAALTVQAKVTTYAPYHQTESNIIYNQLFCDNLVAYKKTSTVDNDPIWQLLFSTKPDIQAIRKLGKSTKANSRQRLLADHILKENRLKPVPKVLLGVIVEVAFENGLDTLAAYRDGSVYYIHRDGHLKKLQKPGKKIAAKVLKLFMEAQPIIEKIKPWPHQRLGPPTAKQVRLSFLVSDGIYFGQGSMKQLELNPLAGPVLTAATELLIQIMKQ